MGSDDLSPPVGHDSPIDDDAALLIVANSADRDSSSPDADMAAAVASMPLQQQFPPPATSPTTNNAAGGNGGVKRYRPVPAKTFQCRGYGECRMVFSRSEHLARHIRKHTGERPFTCHCSKQFSRLDNLRQHAQTVHADKQEQNERMMHELTSLHASMTAASKGGGARGKRSQQSSGHPAGGGGNIDGSIPSMAIKQEDGSMGIPTMHQRPGTSTGYEGGNGIMYHPGASWHVGSNDDRRTASNHSFRDPGQSFRAPTSSSPSSATSAGFAQQQFLQQQQHPGQSFLVPSSATFNFSLPDIPNHSASGAQSGSGNGPRPASSSAGSDHNRSLPPISSVVSASLAGALPLPHQPQPPAFVVPNQPPLAGHTPITESHVLPLPTPSSQFGRRPSTATRPGTAPASYYYPTGSANAFAPGSGPVPAVVAHRPELSLSFLAGGQHGRSNWSHAGPSSSALYRSHSGGGGDSAASGGDEPTSPTGGSYDSPFSFHAPTTTAPSVSDQHRYREQQHSSAGLSNPRKRPHTGSDDDDVPRERGRPDTGRPISSSGWRPGTSGVGGEYEYGSESRPQSRRLSVMELCNDTDADPATRPFIPLSAAAATANLSRPTTSSGLVTSASQLQLSDRPTPPPQQQSPAPSPLGPGSGFLPSQQSLSGAHQQQQRTPSPQYYRASPSLLARVTSAAAGANAAAAGADVSGASPRGGGGSTATTTPRASEYEYGRGVSPASSVGRRVPSPAAYHQQSPRSAGSQSPLFPTAAAAAGGAAAGAGVYGRGRVPSGTAAGDVGSPGSVSSGGSGGSPGGESQRGNDQVRFSAPVGMRA